MVPRLEGAGNRFAGEHRSNGDPAAQALRQGYDVRLDVVVLVGEHLPGAAHSRLHLVEDKGGAVGAGELAGGGQELGGSGIDAALSEDGLEEDGASAGSDGAAQRFDVVEGDVYEAGRKRLKPLMILGLACCGKRAEGAPVEGVEGAHDFVFPGAACLVAVFASKLDGGFDGLGSAVAEEAASAKKPGEALGEA